MNQNIPKIGIDIGTSSIKIIVLDYKKNIIYSEFKKHLGDPDSCLKNLLSEILVHFPLAKIGVCGALSKNLSESGIFHMEAVPSAIEGCRFLAPESECIMEIGASSSKFISGFSDKNNSKIQFFFNSSCSAGTGSFLEEQARRLNITMDELSKQTRLAKKALPIAGRCSVFSRTDIIHFQQAGAQTPDILLGLVYAMARNYKANVIKRHPVKPPVLLSGQTMKIHGIRQALAKTFNLSSKDFILKPENLYVNAIGSAIGVPEQTSIIELSKLCNTLLKKSPSISNASYLPPLEKFDILKNYNTHPCKKTKIKTCFLGIDVGSTSTNLVLISPECEIIDLQYLRTLGSPLDTVKSGIANIKQKFGDDINFLSIGITGSGRSLVGKALNADLVVNEITAQAEGTIFNHPEADTIFEIGGQDSKFIRLKNKAVTDFEMNRICAAGTGAFLEEQAAKIKVSINDFGELAMKGKAPLDLGDRCTVFIEGSLSKAVALGHEKSDIAAGLAYSIARNYLNRVVGNRSIGNRIFIQGGIAHNKGVVNAFRSLISKNISITPYFSVTGALGAGLMCRSKYLSKSSNFPMQDLNKYESTKTCLPISAEIFTKTQELFLEGYKPKRFPGQPTIGIPRVLFLHKLFVLFNRFFTELGFNVLISEPTTPEMVDKSRETAMEETCYPVKLVNGHIDYLIKKNVDYIFLPTVFTMKHSGSKARKDYGCVYMQTIAMFVDHSMNLKEKQITLLSPAISFKFGTRYIAKTILDLGKQLGKSNISTITAMQKAAIGFIKYNKAIARLGNKLISALDKNNPAFVIITRPYGVNDPVLNMNIPNHIMSMGYNVIPLSALDIEDVDISKDYQNMYWPFGQHILAGAKKIRQIKNLYAIYLTNHGCGPDTAILHLFQKEMDGKPFLHLEVDEHGSDVGVITRIEAFVLSFDKKKVSEQKPSNSKLNISAPDKNLPLFIPCFYPYSDIACEFFKQKGFNADILQPTDQLSLEKGKELSAAKEYLSLITLLGDVKKLVLSDSNVQVLIPQTEGSEVEGLYSQVIFSLLKQKFPDLKIYSPFLEDVILSPDFFKNFFLLAMAGDLILSAPVESRQEVLFEIRNSICDFNLNHIIRITSKIASIKQDQGLNLLLTGEPAIVFNPFNHGGITKDISARLSYQPLTEIFYLFWQDFNERKKNIQITKNLMKCRHLMIQVSSILGESSIFEPDPDILKFEADKFFPLFTGSNGRYRLAKRFSHTNINGIINLGSAYENTGIITRQLGESRPSYIPVLNLIFDGSDHNINKELIGNFLYYLEKRAYNLNLT
ncbi:MAG: acyl-CoA dehydratase activase [Desulforegulaceae bacterium]|nr:acyl-CoA dehydratase activase [Desulforegulaceae bacterium]